jgi:cytochrome c oxidase assembly protein subunit 15
MTEPAAVDLAPILQILLAGAAVAAVALGWLQLRARRQSPAHWLRAATVLTLFLTFDLVLFGAFTRLTDSGLGCPDWPGCYGSASPVGAKADISAAQAAMPSGPVTHHKAWIEMVHRYMATGVGALILVLTVVSWRRWWRVRPGTTAPSPWWPTATLVWVCVQGAFGALTVTMKLFPAIVTLHLLGGLLLLALLAIQAQSQTRALAGTPPISVDAATRFVMLLASTLLVLQLALGGWVSTNYAVLACTDFPTCQGSWWPSMRFDEGFQLWRALGMTGDGSAVISFPALTAIHYAHRLMAYVVLLVLALAGVAAVACRRAAASGALDCRPGGAAAGHGPGQCGPGLAFCSPPCCTPAALLRWSS